MTDRRSDVLAPMSVYVEKISTTYRSVVMVIDNRTTIQEHIKNYREEELTLKTYGNRRECKAMEMNE